MDKFTWQCKTKALVAGLTSGRLEIVEHQSNVKSTEKMARLVTVQRDLTRKSLYFREPGNARRWRPVNVENGLLCLGFLEPSVEGPKLIIFLLDLGQE